MKGLLFYPLSLLFGALFLLTGCDSMNRPLGDGSYNPLDPPGTTASELDPYGAVFAPGSFLQTISPSTAFFDRFPGIEDQPSKILPDYTDVKVISTKGSYIKVEVIQTGDIGYVPSVMLGEKRSPEEIQVTPDIDPNPVIPSIQPPGLSDPSQPAE